VGAATSIFSRATSASIMNLLISIHENATLDIQEHFQFIFEQYIDVIAAE
jgi:hypothetical protein